MVMNMWQWK